MKTVHIDTVPHIAQRYDTIGDWYDMESSDCIRISKMRDERSEFLVALHEFIEMKICQFERISPATVDAFDMKYEARRRAGEPGLKDEPGDDHDAPYYMQHQTATKVERLVCAVLGLDWEQHERNCNNPL